MNARDLAEQILQTESKLANHERILGTWAHCVLLSIQCAKLGVSEDPGSVERRRRIAELALNEDPDLMGVLALLKEQRLYLREVLERAGIPVERMLRG